MATTIKERHLRIPNISLADESMLGLPQENPVPILSEIIRNPLVETEATPSDYLSRILLGKGKYLGSFADRLKLLEQERALLYSNGGEIYDIEELKSSFTSFLN